MGEQLREECSEAWKGEGGRTQVSEAGPLAIGSNFLNDEPLSRRGQEQDGNLLEELGVVVIGRKM